MDNVHLKGIRREELDEWFHVLSPWLLDALDKGHGEETLENIRAAARSGDYQLWAVMGDDNPQGAVVTEIIAHKQRTYGQVKYLAGRDRKEWFFLIATLEDWFADRGCDGVILAGRKGWERVVEPYGYALDSVVLRKDL